MKTLHITVANKVATYQRRDGEIICNNSDYLVQFTFDDEWAGASKVARFLWSGKFKDVPINASGVAKVPLMQRSDVCFVGVYSQDDTSLCTTTAAVVPCKRSVFCLGGTAIEGETPDPRPDGYVSDDILVETFDLGIPEILVDAEPVTVEADLTELLHAVQYGHAEIVLPLVLGGGMTMRAPVRIHPTMAEDTSFYAVACADLVSGDAVFEQLGVAPTLWIAIAASENSITVRCRSLGGEKSDGLPEVTEADNGKVLQVVGGEWKPVPVGESAVQPYVKDYVESYVEEYINEALGGDY